jgi:hypothetical protein
MTAEARFDPEFGNINPKASTRRRFVLHMVLTVVATLGVLVGLFLPAIRSSRPAAYRAMCNGHLKQIALALYQYEQDYKTLPPAYTVDSQGRPLHSWRTLILPYLEAEDLYGSIDLAKPWNDPANAMALATNLGIYRCPSAPAAGPGNTTTYLAVTAPDGCFQPGKPRPLAEITDPHESTLMLIEAGELSAVPWMAPSDADASMVLTLGVTRQLHHRGGTNAGLVDGTVHFLKASTPVAVLSKLISIAGNDNPSYDEW